MLSWALTGPPVAWIVGMPLIGTLGAASWRFGWVALPLVAALGAVVAVVFRGGSATSIPAAAFVAGGRTLLGNLFGLELAPERRLAKTGLRAAATQFGYFVGTAVAGTALAVYGWSGFGVAAALLVALAPIPLVVGPVSARRLRVAVDAA